MTSNVSDLVNVKPLEWKNGCARTLVGTYHVHQTHTLQSWYALLDGSGVGDPYVTTEDEAKSAAQADYESRILAALTPAEPCFSVKGGYEVKAEKKFFARPYRNCHLTEALSIRSAEEVRREALEEAARVVKGEGFAGYHDPMRKVTMKQILALIDTPAPSTDTTPSVAEAAKEWHLGSMNDGLFIIDARPQPSNDHVCHDRPDGPDLVIPVHGLTDKQAQEIVDAHNTALRALAAQTGGE